jgi:hypothetical protein
MIGSSNKHTLRQAKTTTPIGIARINERLMAQRINAGQATELLRGEYPVWGAMRGQFKGRRVLVGPEFVVQDSVNKTEPALGFLGLLSVERVDVAKQVDGRASGIRYIGDAVVAHLFEDVERYSEVARVLVSLPGELSLDGAVQRTVYTDPDVMLH